MPVVARHAGGGAASPWLVSVLIGLACLRLRGPYVALLTLAIAQVIYLLIVNDTACFTNPPRAACPCSAACAASPASATWASASCSGPSCMLGHYYVGLGAAGAGHAFSIVIIRGPLGLAFQALRDNPGYAMSRGISRFKYQIWVFALSAFFTGLAGAFYAAQFGVVGPNRLLALHAAVPARP